MTDATPERTGPSGLARNGAAAAQAAAPPPVLRASGFSKTFGPVTVLRAVDLTVDAGSVVGLIGQNGSGKSTFIKVLTGFHEPDAGAGLEINGQAVTFPFRAQEAAALGISAMHQDLGLVGDLPVIDNVLLGGRSWRSPLRRISWRAERERVTGLLADVGLDVDVTRPVGQLTGGQRALVAMARAFDRLGERGGLLVLDEPTAALEQEGARLLFDAIRRVRDRGAAVLFVSHDLQEVSEICDEVVVLRDGHRVAAGPIADFDQHKLVHAIVGRDIGQLYPDPPADHTGEPVLVARGLRGGRCRDVGLSLHAGEVLGVTGLAGMGQDDLPALLFGAQTPSAGEVSLFGAIHRPAPRASLAAGMVLCPADRKGLGGDMGATLRENLGLPVVRRYMEHGRLDVGAERDAVATVLKDFDVRPPDPERKLGELSGGNQQKALLGKWMQLHGGAKVLLLHEPTQGVDVGARQEIFRLIRGCADRGMAVLYVSCEHEDLSHLCDRVLVMRAGRVVADVAGEQLDAGHLAALSLSA